MPPPPPSPAASLRRRPPRRKTRYRRRRRGARPARSPRVLGAARARLRGFKHATIVAVALTSLLLLVLMPSEVGFAQDGGAPFSLGRGVASGGADDAADAPGGEEPPLEKDAEVEVQAAAAEASQRASITLRGVWRGFLVALPKMGIAASVLLIAWLLSRLARRLLHRLHTTWERSTAVAALVQVSIWTLAVGISISLVVGDVRALIGSIGLLGLALSWALQTPIESFTGWLLNSFRGYYRVGDRIAVGDVFGDVYRIDVLTTMVWEIGQPDKGPVRAEQPTGRLITFPNHEVLTGSIVNVTREFNYVWDEIAVAVADASDLRYAVSALEGVAARVVGEQMQAPAHRYQEALRRHGIDVTVPDRPQVYASMEESWIALTIRYLVASRERRKWKSDLVLAVSDEMKRPEHAGRIVPAYPRRQVQVLDARGAPV